MVKDSSNQAEKNCKYNLDILETQDDTESRTGLLIVYEIWI